MPDITLKSCLNENGRLVFRREGFEDSPTWFGCVDWTTGKCKITIGPALRWKGWGPGVYVLTQDIEDLEGLVNYKTVYECASVLWREAPSSPCPPDFHGCIRAAVNSPLPITCMDNTGQSDTGIITDICTAEAVPQGFWLLIIATPEAAPGNLERVIINSISMKKTTSETELITNGDFSGGLEGWTCDPSYWAVIGNGDEYEGCMDWATKKFEIDIPLAVYNAWL